MAHTIKGHCKQCGEQFGPYLDYGGSVYRCGQCGDYQRATDQPRSFALPLCLQCGNRFQISDLVELSSLSQCPWCNEDSVAWNDEMQVLVVSEETPPIVGEKAQGYIRNTGSVQRIEFVHSNFRGRVPESEPEFEDGTPVEAEITDVGRRSATVANVRILTDVPRSP